MKIKIQIKSYFGTVLFEAKKEDYTIKGALRDAVLQGAVLQGAVLQGADLRGAVLQGAYLKGAVLQGADLQGAVLRDAYLQGAYLKGAVLQGADLQGAVLRDAYLQGAYLKGAVLQGAVLQGADLRDAKNIPQSWINECSRDILYILKLFPSEVPFLRKALMDGKVNGQMYEGGCACLIGTIAKADGGMEKVCAAIPFYDRGTHNPGENFFLNIREGDTPENSFFAKHAVELCDMVVKPKSAKKPKK